MQVEKDCPHVRRSERVKYRVKTKEICNTCKAETNENYEISSDSHAQREEAKRSRGNDNTNNLKHHFNENDTENDNSNEISSRNSSIHVNWLESEDSNNDESASEHDNYEDTHDYEFNTVNATRISANDYAINPNEKSTKTTRENELAKRPIRKSNMSDEDTNGAHPAGYIAMNDFQEAIRLAVSNAVQQTMAALVPAPAPQVNPNPNLPNATNNVHHHWGDTSQIIPNFDPENAPHQTITMWLKKVDDAATAYGWNERMTINSALPKLKGSAKTWFEGLSTSVYTWTEWKTKLEEWFPPSKGCQQLHREMEQYVRKPNDTVEKYYHDKVAKARLCGLTEEAMIEYLITGLNDRELITALSVREFKSPPELLKCIQQLEGRLRVTNSSNENRRRPPTGKPQETSTRWPPREMDHKQTNQNVQHAKPRFGKPKYNDRGQSLCYNCNEYGHIARTCPKPQKRIRCETCQRVGHETKDCRQSATSREIMLIDDDQPKVDGNEKYFMQAYVNEKPIQSYVDMGSKCVLIRKSTADEYGLTIREPERGLTIGGYGGGSRILPVGMTKAKIKVDQVNAEVEMIVVRDENQDIPLLIGQPLTELPNVTVIKRKNAIRLFEEDHSTIEDNSLHKMQIPELPPQAVNLWACKASVIQTDYVGFIDLHSRVPQESELEVFVDEQLRMAPGKEYYIPRGVYSVDKDGFSSVPIINLSGSELKIKTGEKMLRAKLCEALPEDQVIETLHVDTKTSKNITINEINVASQVHDDYKVQLCNLLNEYGDCFASELRELGHTTQTAIKIELTTDKPITYRPYRLSHAERGKVRTKIAELLDAGVIEESSSPYSSPILIVKKKTGDERLCVDYRALNRITKKDAFPLPLIDDQLERLSGNKFFTSLDLISGYYQIPVDEESQDKTAFITPDGHYHFLRMPFGLVNGPAIFQKMMNSVLGSLRFAIALTYMDDVLIPSQNEQQGIENLRTILEVFRRAKLTLNLKKCYFLQTNIDYLGFEITENGIRPGERKITGVRDFPRPQNVHEVRRFLGLTSYFRRFVKGFATITAPLSTLLRKDEEFNWTDDQEKSFKTCKELLTTRPILGLYDPRASTEVHTDASQVGLGAMLMQRDEQQKLHPVHYASRKLTKEESRYHSSELETLAVVWGLSKFRVYLIGIPFTVITDCSAVRSALGKKHLVPRIGRWWLSLQEYEFEVQHRPGERMAHVDALSRAPTEEAEEMEIVSDITVLHTEVQTDDWLIMAQYNDKKIQSIKETLQKRTKLTKEDKRIQEEFILERGRVFRRFKTDEKEMKLWVVPDAARWRIVKMNHDDIGHVGIEKTCLKVQELFWFPRLRRSNNPSNSFIEDELHETFSEEVMQRRNKAIESIKIDQEKQRKRYNAKRAHAPNYQPGDLVVVERQPRATGQPLKTSAKYRGPYVVTDKLNYDRYVIEDLPENQRTNRFYRNTAPVDKLKRFPIIDNTSDKEESSDDEISPSPALSNPDKDDELESQSEEVPGNEQDPETDSDLTDGQRQRSSRKRKLPSYLKDFIL